MLKNVLIYNHTPDPAPRSPALTVLPRCANDHHRLTDFLLGFKDYPCTYTVARVRTDIQVATRVVPTELIY